MKTAPSLTQLKRALALAEKIETLKAELAGALSAGPTPEPKPTEPAKTKRKYTMSPESREKIAAAQKRRWAKVREAATRAGAKPAGDLAIL